MAAISHIRRPMQRDFWSVAVLWVLALGGCTTQPTVRAPEPTTRPTLATIPAGVTFTGRGSQWSWSGVWVSRGAGKTGNGPWVSTKVCCITLRQDGNRISGSFDDQEPLPGQPRATLAQTGEVRGDRAYITVQLGTLAPDTREYIMSDDGRYAKQARSATGADWWERMGRPTGLDGSVSGGPTLQPQPTYQAVPTPAQPAYVAPSTTTSAGSAPCKIADGYQTVRFSDGAVYSGTFQNCRPLAGPAQYQQGSSVLTGYAEPVDDRTVRLRSGNNVATITLQIESVGR